MTGKFICLLLTISFLTAAAFAQKKSQDSAPAYPKCSAPISSLPVPNGPHGLFVLMFPGAPQNGKAEKYLMHNPVVCGGAIYVIWSKVDRGPGANPRYDWSSVEDQMAPWVAAGKMVSFIVWATGYGANAEATPQYVFDKVPSVTCPSFGHTPVFWNHDFMSSYQSFMAAMVDKFKNNASVSYIRFGMGAGGETFPACMFALKKYGFSESTWQKYLYDMLDYEKSLNSPKQIGIGISAFGNPPNLDNAAATADHAVKDGIAIGNQALSGRDVQDYGDGRPCTGNWCRNFIENKGKVPFVLQTAMYNWQGNRTSMVEAIPFAMGLGAQVFELTMRHWISAYDPSDPDYAAHHAEDQKMFEDAAKTLGGS